MSAFLRLLGAFLAIVFTDTILVCLCTIAAFAIANGLLKHHEPQWEPGWPQIRQPVATETAENWRPE